jgi:hypothetical protein
MVIGIIGMTQGGTSAVAAVVRNLGFPLFGVPRCLDDAALFGPEEIPQSIIEQRIREHPKWAWKYPVAYSEDLDFSTHFIVVWRDPIARAVHRRDLNAPNPVVFDEWFEIAPTFSKISKPVLHVSYEKLLQHPQKQVQTIADFLGTPISLAAIQAVDPQKGYDANS